MKSVLFIANYRPSVGGISGQVALLQKHLRQEGVVANIISLKGSIFKKIKSISRIKKEGEKYDVFHVHTCSNMGFLTAIVGISLGGKLHKRVVVTYHGGGGAKFFSNYPRLVKKFLLKSDANIVLSGFLGMIFDRYEIPYTVIPNIIELDITHFHLRETIFPNFICIRTLDPLYNIHCIIKAFDIVKKQLPKATLTLVGDGSERQRLEQIVQEMNLCDVVFVGRVKNCEIYEYLDKADIMLSSPIIDNMPVSVLEGFNAGLLVVSSNVGGIPYMIEDGVNGLLFENNNYQQLAEKMLWVVEHQNEAKKIIYNANRSVQAYEWNNIKEKLFAQYGFIS